MILRIMNKTKSQFNLIYMEPQNESFLSFKKLNIKIYLIIIGELFEKISNIVINIINENQENFSLHTLSSIVNTLNANKSILTPATNENINQAGRALLQKYKTEFKDVEFSKLNLAPYQFYDIFIALLNSTSNYSILNMLPDLLTK